MVLSNMPVALLNSGVCGCDIIEITDEHIIGSTRGGPPSDTMLMARLGMAAILGYAMHC